MLDSLHIVSGQCELCQLLRERREIRGKATQEAGSAHSSHQAKAHRLTSVPSLTKSDILQVSALRSPRTSTETHHLQGTPNHPAQDAAILQLLEFAGKLYKLCQWIVCKDLHQRRKVEGFEGSAHSQVPSGETASNLPALANTRPLCSMRKHLYPAA
eukprot:1392-Pelagomonas_calceolata.AAC.2